MRSNSASWAYGAAAGALAGAVLLGLVASSTAAPLSWAGTGILAILSISSGLWAKRQSSAPSKDGVQPDSLSSEAQARTFLSTVDEMVYFQGLDGSLALLNDANQRITGYSLEEWKAKPDLWRDIVHPEDQKVAEAFFAEYPEGTASFEVEYRLRDKSGEWHWIQSRMVGVRDESGRYIGYNCVDRDVTEHKRMLVELEQHRNHLDQLVEVRTRELLEAKRHAEEASLTKTRFLANMSHEVRTPMNAVVGLGQLLAGTDLDTEQRSYLETIQDSANSLLTVIDGILDLSRIEAEDLELDLRDFHLRSKLEKVLKSFDHQAKQLGLTLTHRIDPELPERLRGDPDRLSQVLKNLIGNALKFTPQGSVELTVSPQKLSPQETGADDLLLRFEITDTGIGIAPEDGESIFDPFSQVDSSSARRYGGTGLGLAIAKELCELMGGEIGFDSQLGKGSTFWFTAPFRPAVA